MSMDALGTFQVVTGAIAIYNSCETLGLIFTTFNKWRGLYFWSLLVAAIGDFLFTIGFLDLFFAWYDGESTIYRPLFILTVGWYGMVTGFSFVLYSRLGIIGVGELILRRIRIMIGLNIVFSHFPTTVLTFGSNIVDTDPWNNGYSIMEKIQMTFFCIQELILGGLYLHYTRRVTYDKKFTKIVKHTMYANAFVMILDFAMLITEYAGLYSYQIMLKAVVYSVKLKLEFYILNVLSKSLGPNGNVSRVSAPHKSSEKEKHPRGLGTDFSGRGSQTDAITSANTATPDIRSNRMTGDGTGSSEIVLSPTTPNNNRRSTIATNLERKGSDRSGPSTGVHGELEKSQSTAGLALGPFAMQHIFHHNIHMEKAAILDNTTVTARNFI